MEPDISQISFAWGQRKGGRKKQEDSLLQFEDECFALADGLGSWSNSEVASKLAVETAIWGYAQIRQRPFYWRDKKLLLRRIFRTTNLTLWQRQREKEFASGLGTTLLVVILGPRTLWLGSVGDSSAYLYRDSLIDTLTKPDRDEAGKLTRLLGATRTIPSPEVAIDKFLPGDLIILASDGAADYWEEEELRQSLDGCNRGDLSLPQTVKQLLDQAEANGSGDNLTVAIIKRLSNCHFSLYT